jgi:peptidylprolyl isomerase
MNKTVISILAALALVVAGCGGSSSTTSSGDSSSAANDTTTSAAKPFVIPTKGEPPIVYAKEFLEKEGKNGLVGPELKPVMPKGPPPKSLALTDLIEGIGPLATEGSKVTVQYVGVLYGSGKKFDSSWDHGEPFTFKLGAGEVIPGWEEGIKGMEVADRRELVVPPDLAYGSQQVGSIPPNSTLIFVVELLKVNGKGE